MNWCWGLRTLVMWILCNVKLRSFVFTHKSVSGILQTIFESCFWITKRGSPLLSFGKRNRTHLNCLWWSWFVICLCFLWVFWFPPVAAKHVHDVLKAQSSSEKEILNLSGLTKDKPRCGQRFSCRCNRKQHSNWPISRFKRNSKERKCLVC